jgi:spore photoproduct lyase
VVVAYSLSPQDVASAVEAGAPSLAKRIEAVQKLQDRGWRIGLRFDPIIWHADYQSSYAEMLQQIFYKLDADRIDSVTLGGFRLPKGFYKTMRRLHPEHWLFSAGLAERDGMVAYTPEIEHEVLSTLEEMIVQNIDPKKLYKYTC